MLVIGSGPAAAAVALAVTACGRDEVEVVDVGERLEAHKRDLLDRVAPLTPAQWPAEVALELSQQPVPPAKGELPQKRVFGSDFPFRDRGQLAALTAEPGANASSISAAFGGFSNAWGAQVMPFSRRTFESWPIGYEDLVAHYDAILRQIPFAGADDDYSELFPMIVDAAPLPPRAPPAAAVLSRYRAHRSFVRRRGVTVGAARLAMDSGSCIECGLCLTGCPRGLIYSASQTLDRLAAARRIRHTPGMLVHRIGEDGDGCWADARDLSSGQTRTFRSDRVFVACGGLGSTQVVLNSARAGAETVAMAESVQIVLPFLSARPQPDPRTYATFTLNQFNMLVSYGRPGLDLAQFHLYPYNPAFDDALPGPVGAAGPLRRAVLRRTVAALGYLPSWASPGIRLGVGARIEGQLPAVSLSASPSAATAPALRRVVAQVLSVAPALDLWPVLPVLRLSGAAKSYHFGASFPHVTGPPREGALETDTLGRIAEWRRIHIVDGAVLPSIPATTFTLSVMANAHRIAAAAVQDLR